MALPTPSEILSKVQSSPDTDTVIPSPQDVLSSTQKVTSKTPEKSFLRTLGEGAGAIFKGVGEKIYGKLEERFGYRPPVEINVTPDDLLQGISITAKGIGKGAKFLAEGINEGVVRIIKSTSEAAIGPERTKRIAEFGGPISPAELSKDITGRDRVSSYQEIKQKTKDYALRNNASLDTAEMFSGFAVIGALFADNPIFAPGKRALIKLADEVIEDLMQANTDDVVRGILRKEIPELSGQEVDALTPIFRNAQDGTQIRAVVDQVNKAQRAPVREGSETPQPEKVARNVAEEVREREAVEATAKIADEFQPITKQAQKFETVEDLNESIIQKLKTTFADDVAKNIAKLKRSNYDIDIARTADINDSVWAGLISDPSRKKIDAIKEAIQKGEEMPPIILSGKGPPVDGHHRLQAFKELDIEDVQVLRIIPLEKGEKATGKIKNLEEIFNKAKQEAIKPTPLRQFSPNLLQAISREDLSGPVADMLRKEFPNISDKTITALAKPLSKMKRTDDITGLLRSAENINNRGKGASIPTAPELKRVFEDDPSLKYLSPDQVDNYIDNIRESIKAPENSVLAQNEYDVLMSQADQKAIDQMNSLQIEREILKETVHNDPARKLLKYARDGKLPEVTGKPTRISPDTGKRIPTSVFGRTGDDIITELGFESVDDAQKGLTKYIEIRDHLKVLDDEARDLRPKVRASKILRDLGDEVPVISQGRAGEINKLASIESVENIYKDISGFAGGFRDLWRNSAKFFGPEFSKMKKVILDPFDDAKGSAVDELVALGDDLEKNIVKKLNIKKGSKESKAIQQYGDTGLHEGDRLNFDQLVEKFGLERAGDIIEAEGWLKKTYNRMIDEINEVRGRIYPNDPLKLIPKRKDYFRHFQEMGDGLEGISNILFETGPLGNLGVGIDPKLAGLSEYTKPKTKFLSFAQQRTGKATEIDAVGGFINYTSSFVYAKHIDPHIANFRYLRRILADSAQTPGMLKKTADERGEGINNFLEYLDDFANNLANKTTSLDRWVQKRIPGGRKTLQVTNRINNRIKANTILANFSSTIAQLFNLPNGIASAKFYNIPGAHRTVASIIQENGPMQASTFIKERYVRDMSARFKVGWIEHPVKRTTESALEFGRWSITVLDELATKHMWNSHYSKAIAEGIENPVRYADNEVRKLVAGRGIGEIPIEQQGRIFKLIAPFQVEVGNAWWVLKDFVDKKDFGAIATLLTANFIMNEAAERTRGSRVVFDPINSLIEGSLVMMEEIDDGNYWRAGEKFLGRQAGEVISNVPLGQTISSFLVTPLVEKTTGLQARELFGEGDPGRFGSGILIANGLADPLTKLLPPLGGVQAKKTWDGIWSMVKGEVRDKGRKLSFSVDPDIRSITQAVLFGKYATPEARDFFDERDDLFQRIYRQDASRENLRLEAEEFWAEMKEVSKEKGKEESVKMIKDLESNNPELAEKVGNVADEEALGLNGNERLTKMLGVMNGERAKYISEEFKKLKTKEERVSFMQNLDDKNLISDIVFEQLQILLPKVLAE